MPIDPPGMISEHFYCPPDCFRCAHYTGDQATIAGSKCKAFPDGIPNSIILGDVDHDKPIDGDHGFRFEPIFPPEVEDLLEDNL